MFRRNTEIYITFSVPMKKGFGNGKTVAYKTVAWSFLIVLDLCRAHPTKNVENASVVYSTYQSKVKN